ncbi:hypothetical protein ACQP00_35930 [Dactylosporangium sp. CS-047395]|uniref:hypothetical protein n=1 Tax=Dactylosporangium sp. CS-047395 TaxID=3239936 RepID=UPI003D94145C
MRRGAAGGSAIDPAVVARLLGRPSKVSPLDRAHRPGAGGPGAVETHVNGVFTKLGLFPAAEEHRRVKAVLAYLSAR